LILPTKLCGDARAVLPTLPVGHFHCCVTSIPYWGLRSYLPKGHPQKALEIGTEPSFDLFLEHIVEVFDQVWQVLREDGTLWLNCGDAYASNGGAGWQGKNGQRANRRFTRPNILGNTAELSGLKNKDLLMMPARVAMALQASGWYLRSMIPWIKRNAMPESVTDRPAAAVEYVFMFSKSERCYYDRDAVKMPVSEGTNARVSQAVLAGPSRAKQEDYADTGHNGKKSRDRTPMQILRSMGANPKSQPSGNGVKANDSFHAATTGMVSERNRRNSDWMLETWQGMVTDEEGDPLAFIVNPKGTSIAHFAAYPPKLIIPMIQASTSDRGCCSKCGAPLTRVTDKVRVPPDTYDGKYANEDNRSRNLQRSIKAHRKNGGDHDNPWPATKTTGWKPGCDCVGEDVEPCRVLDPFSGISTTLMVARDLGRHSTGIDINEEYQRLASPRDAQAALL
jgi:site-specific DNA-methyltransferase (cytosine-N4-specific)